MADNMIVVKDVSRGFEVGGNQIFWALKHINMEIPRGHLTILRGRSGSGKTMSVLEARLIETYNDSLIVSLSKNIIISPLCFFIKFYNTDRNNHIHTENQPFRDALQCRHRRIAYADIRTKAQNRPVSLRE